MKKEYISILVIDNNPADVRMVEEMLKERIDPVCRIAHCELLKDAVEKLKCDKFDVILLDINLPDSRGWDGLDCIMRQNPSIPVIILTGLNDEKIGIEAVRRHAEDYLVKGQITSSLLFRSIQYAIERRQAKEILKRDKGMLEKIVMDRSRDLIKAYGELEKAKRLSDIGVLSATIAHELRNPLAAINMAVANIKRKAQNPALDKHLANIEKKVLEGDRIISNLLFYSRIGPPHYESVDINEIIDECIDSLRQQHSKKEISVEKNLTSIKDYTTEADPLQLKEVLSNILNNAGDALPEAGGRIEILGENKEVSVTIHIKDNGAGIDKAHLDKIFDPFFTTKAKGTGLGMTVCKQIIEMHGGTIRVESEPGKGTNVSIVLPRKK